MTQRIPLIARDLKRLYTGFLYTQGDERGLQSYGACTDLLVAYYLEEGL